MAQPTGQAQFPALPVPLKTQTLWGHVTQSAGVYSIQSGSSTGFTITKNSAGNLTITFTAPFANTGYAFVVSATNGYTETSAQGTGSIQVQLLDTSDAALDTGFDFIAIGVIA